MSRSECCSCLVISVVSDSMWPHGLHPVRLICPWDSPGKSTEVDCHALLQGIFPTQGSNLGLLHCRRILYRWATREAPRSECNSSNVKHTNLMSWTSICFLLQNPRPASRKQKCLHLLGLSLAHPLSGMKALQSQMVERQIFQTQILQDLT